MIFFSFKFEYGSTLYLSRKKISSFTICDKVIEITMSNGNRFEVESSELNKQILLWVWK